MHRVDQNRLALLASLALLALHGASAQTAIHTAGARGTPRACLEAGDRYRDSVFEAEKRAGSTHLPDYDGIQRAIVARARVCAATFNVATIDLSRLTELGVLYAKAQEPALAQRAFARAFGRGGLRDTARANAMVSAVEAYLVWGNPSDTATSRTRSEELVAGLDSMRGAIDQRFRARVRVLGAYWGEDSNEGVDRVTREMQALARQMSPAEVHKNAADIVYAYVDLAALYGDQLRADSAAVVLHRAVTDIPALASAPSEARKALASTVARYEMIGRPAPVLHADAWVNGPGSERNPGATLVVFTAWWCHDCVSSYPFLTALDREFKPEGLHLVFATNLEGQFRGVPMTSAQEVEADRHYYVEEHGFTCPIAIDQRGSTDSLGTVAPTETSNDIRYQVWGYPQFAIIDHDGIVRAVIAGWAAGHPRDRAIRTMVEQLLSAKSTG